MEHVEEPVYLPFFHTLVKEVLTQELEDKKSEKKTIAELTEHYFNLYLLSKSL